MAKKTSKGPVAILEMSLLPLSRWTAVSLWSVIYIIIRHLLVYSGFLVHPYTFSKSWLSSLWSATKGLFQKLAVQSVVITKGSLSFSGSSSGVSYFHKLWHEQALCTKVVVAT